MKQFASDLHLDTRAFNTCLDTHKHQEEIKQNRLASTALKVSSTPSLLINGIPVLGAETLDVFSQIIEQAKVNK